MSRVFYDVSSIFIGRDGRLTGIPRVELEVGRRLIAGGAQAIRWHERLGRFVTVDFADTIEAIATAHALDIETVLDAPRTDWRWRPLARAALAVLAGLAGCARRAGLADCAHWLRYLVGHGLAAMHPAMSPRERRGVAERAGITASRQASIGFLRAVVAWRDGPPSLRRGAVVAFECDDIVVTLSVWWDARAFDVLRRADVALLGWVHDLIPILRPELAPRDMAMGKFRDYAAGLIRGATMLCAGTAHVARDIAAHARALEVTAPPVRVVPLCSELPRVSPRLTPFLTTHGLEPGRFALFVSSINPRKNHAWAYRLWRQAQARMGEDLPTLVFAGERRWDDDDLMSLLRSDAQIWGRHLKFVSSPTDAELAWLYRHCAYTIFPSAAEGWGLPITESLSYGKYCLAADDDSLRAAGAGLAFHADTQDVDAWLIEMERIAREPGYLAACEQRITSGYRIRGWDDVAHDVSLAVRRARQLHMAQRARGGAVVAQPVAALT